MSKHYWVLSNGVLANCSNFTYTHIEYVAEKLSTSHSRAYEIAFEEGWIRLMIEGSEINISLHKKAYSLDAVKGLVKFLEKRNYSEYYLEFSNTREQKHYKKNNKSELFNDLEFLIVKRPNKISTRRPNEMKITDFL